MSVDPLVELSSGRIAQIGFDNSDLAPLAKLHREAFPNFFLSQLGPAFLKQFYAGFIGDPSAVVVILRSGDGEIVGAAVGSVRPERFFRNLLLRRLPQLFSASLLATVRDPRKIGRLLAGVRYRGSVEAERPDGALLSSICVNPNAQGSGLGRDLIRLWTARAAALGASSAYLTTDAADNTGVNLFYLSNGWRLHGNYVTPEGRAMNIYTREVEMQG